MRVEFAVDVTDVDRAARGGDRQCGARGCDSDAATGSLERRHAVQRACFDAPARRMRFDRAADVGELEVATRGGDDDVVAGGDADVPLNIEALEPAMPVVSLRRRDRDVVSVRGEVDRILGLNLFSALAAPAARDLGGNAIASGHDLYRADRDVDVES